MRDGAFARHRLGVDMKAGARDVAEEVGLALGAGRIELRRFVLQTAEDLVQRLAQSLGDLFEALAVQLPDAGLFEVGQLLEELHEPEVALDACEERFGPVVLRAARLQRAVEQGEAAVDARLFARDARGCRVVGTRVGAEK